MEHVPVQYVPAPQQTPAAKPHKDASSKSASFGIYSAPRGEWPGCGARETANPCPTAWRVPWHLGEYT